MRPRRVPTVGLIPKPQRQQLDESFEQAKAKLTTHQGQGPFVVASKVSQTVFDGWDDDNKAAWGLAYNSATESMLLYGDTGPVHSGLQGYFLQQFTGTMGMLSLELAGLSFDSSTYEQRQAACEMLGLPCVLGRTTMYTEMGAKSPDASFYADGFGAKSVVIEIAHQNESFQELRQEVARWHAAGVGLALGIFVDSSSDSSDPNLILLSHSLEHSSARQQRFG